MILNNISSLCQKNNISIARLEKTLGIGNGTIGGWDRASPTVSKLKLVADYFHVTVDDLIREDVNNGS